MDPIIALESPLVTNASEPDAPVTGETTGRPRVWTAFAAWLAAIIMGLIAVVAGYIAVGFVIGLVMGVQGGDTVTIQARVQEIIQQPLPALLLSLLPFQLGMGVVVLFAASRSSEPLKQRLGLLPQSGRTFSGVSLTTMAAFTMSASLISLVGSTLFLGEAPASPMSTALNDGSWWAVMLLSVILSIIPALIEETLFRGYIQRRLLQRWSPIVSIGVSTLLFSVIHVDSLQHMIAVVPLGVVTGLLAYRTNSIKPGMLVHAIHNATAVGIGALVRVLTPRLGNESVGLMVLGLIVVLGVIGLPAVISLLRRAPSPTADMPLIMPRPAVEALASEPV